MRRRTVSRFWGLTGPEEKEAIVREVGRWIAANGAERMTQQRLYRDLGLIPQRILRHWDSFGDFRVALGLPRRKEKAKLYSDEDLLEELHRMRESKGHFPTMRELTLEGQIKADTFRKRFGPFDKIVARYNDWLAERNEEPFEDDLPGPVEVKAVWDGLRVGFASRMSGYRDRKMHRNFSHDFVVCVEDDWPGCPVPVVRLGDVGWDGSRGKEVRVI
ncbi:MAG: hypothetical protein AAGJ97_02355 [Planctomycetota bacterium]